jgi:hypothetical protein
MNRFLSAIAACCVLTTLPACAMGPKSQMVGGPCSYDSMDVTGTVEAVYEDAALIKEDGTDIVFEIALSRFSDPPEKGQRFRLAKRFIVEGTCTPYSYMLGGRIDASEQKPVSSE